MKNEKNSLLSDSSGVITGAKGYRLLGAGFFYIMKEKVTNRDTGKSATLPKSSRKTPCLPNCRPAVERLAKMSEIIQARQPFNCTTLAEEFEVSVKTIQRDIEFLKYRLNLDMEYNQRTHSWILVDAPESVVAFLRLLAPQQLETRRERARWLEAA